MGLIISFIILMKTFASEGPNSLYNSSQKQFNNRNYTEALSLVKRSISLSKDNYSLELKAKIERKMGKNNESKKSFQNSINIIDNDTLKLTHIKNILDWLLTEKDTINSNDYLKQILNIFKDTANNNFQKQYLYSFHFQLEFMDTSSAIETLNSLNNLKPNGLAYNYLGNIYMSKKEYRKAIKLYSKAIVLIDNNGAFYNNIGIAYENRKKKKLAIKNYKLAIEYGDQNACKNLREITAKIKYNKISRCWDGTSSEHTGRGACSGHGGVKHFEKEPYKEYTMNYECK